MMKANLRHQSVESYKKGFEVITALTVKKKGLGGFQRKKSRFSYFGLNVTERVMA